MEAIIASATVGVPVALIFLVLGIALGRGRSREAGAERRRVVEALGAQLKARDEQMLSVVGKLKRAGQKQGERAGASPEPPAMRRRMTPPPVPVRAREVIEEDFDAAETRVYSRDMLAKLQLGVRSAG